MHKTPQPRFSFKHLASWPVHLIMTQCTDLGLEQGERAMSGLRKKISNQRNQKVFLEEVTPELDLERWTNRVEHSRTVNCESKHTGRKLQHVQENQNYFHWGAAQDE